MSFSQKVFILVISLVLLVIGLACLVSPKTIQAWALDWSARGLGARINPLQQFIAGPSYIWSTRLIGALALLMAFVGIFVMMRNST